MDLVEQVVNKGNQQLKEKIQGDLIKLKDNIVKEANEHGSMLRNSQQT